MHTLRCKARTETHQTHRGSHALAQLSDKCDSHAPVQHAIHTYDATYEIRQLQVSRHVHSADHTHDDRYNDILSPRHLPSHTTRNRSTNTMFKTIILASAAVAMCSAQNIVELASSVPELSTLVTAVKAAGLVDTL
jgi:uncharacterized surface protein with fasciclin (FAS1) repeats